MSKSFSTPEDTAFALWLVVPAKPFGEGKSRLATVLSPDARAELSRRWLAHVLSVAQSWGRLAGVAVISRDAEVLAVAEAWGALPVVESGNDLNAALIEVSAVAAAAGAEAVLALPADLPLVTEADLEELYTLALYGEVVIAPSHDGGTNALLLRPPQAIPYSFGEASFASHLALAEAAGLVCHVYQSATLALDVDRPEDLLVVNN